MAFVPQSSIQGFERRGNQLIDVKLGDLKGLVSDLAVYKVGVPTGGSDGMSDSWGGAEFPGEG